MRGVSTIDDTIDRLFVDGTGELAGRRSLTRSACRCGECKPGRLRQYVMFVVVGTVALFILVSFFWNYLGTVTTSACNASGCN